MPKKKKPEKTKPQAIPKPSDGWSRISLDEARKLAKLGFKDSILIWWRPKENLPEEKQYCLVTTNK